MNQRGIAWILLVPLILITGYFLLFFMGVGLTLLFKSVAFILAGAAIVYAAWFTKPNPFGKNAGLFGLGGIALLLFGIFGQGLLFSTAAATASGSTWHANSSGISGIVESQPLSLVSCSAPSPYDICYGWDETYGNATAQARIFTYQLVQGERSGSNFIGPTHWGGDTNPGSNLYFTETCYSTWDAFWAAAGCTDTGCTGFTKVNTPFDKILSTVGNPYSGCPTLIAVNKTTTSTYWAWAMTAYGWNGGNRLTNLTSIDAPNPTPIPTPTPTTNPTPTPNPTTNPTPTPTPVCNNPCPGGCCDGQGPDYVVLGVIAVIIIGGIILFMPKKWLKKL